MVLLEILKDLQEGGAIIFLACDLVIDDFNDTFNDRLRSNSSIGEEAARKLMPPHNFISENKGLYLLQDVRYTTPVHQGDGIKLLFGALLRLRHIYHPHAPISE